LNIYKKINNGIFHAFELFAVLCLAAMVISVFVQVTGRYVFSKSPAWTEEMARQFMIIFSFIGIAIGVRDKIHIGLPVIVDNLNRKIRLPIEILGKLLVVLLGIMMSVNMGLLFRMLQYNRLPGTGLPVLVIYAFPTAIGVLLALISAYQVYDHFRFGTDEEQALAKEAAAEEPATEPAANVEAVPVEAASVETTPNEITPVEEADK
jgi:TRAP-type C4-dicarboxylate transport system permease small subunit